MHCYFVTFFSAMLWKSFLLANFWATNHICGKGLSSTIFLWQGVEGHHIFVARGWGAPYFCGKGLRGTIFLWQGVEGHHIFVARGWGAPYFRGKGLRSTIFAARVWGAPYLWHLREVEARRVQTIWIFGT